MIDLPTVAQITGRDDSHLVSMKDGHRLHPAAARAFGRLQQEAREAGFDLAVASSYRSFDRQMAIFNGKAAGQRPVHDDAGKVLDMVALAAADKLAAILRYSALPGTSRHHWGTDLDVYDAAAMPADYRLQLTPDEVAPGGLFDPLHNWLDQRMAKGDSHGFFRPYGEDRGGVAVERWHLSYAPLARRCEGLLSAEILRQCWAGKLELADIVEARLEDILARYVDVPDNWCHPD